MGLLNSVLKVFVGDKIKVRKKPKEWEIKNEIDSKATQQHYFRKFI